MSWENVSNLTNMIALWIAVLSAVWLSSVEAQNYTVHSSFVFANTGDRTPLLDTDSQPTLTNLGAQQMYNLVCVLAPEIVPVAKTLLLGRLLPPKVHQRRRRQPAHWLDHASGTLELEG
jgi:hypothetical protein